MTPPPTPSRTRGPLLAGGVLAVVLGGVLGLGLAPAAAASPFDVVDGTIATVNDGVLYSPPLAPTTTAVETAIVRSPLGPVQDAANARYARLKALLAP